MRNFVEEKNRLSEMVKLLIHLYYEMKGRDGLTDTAVAMIEDFVSGVTVQAFKYDEKGGQSDDHYTIPTFDDADRDATKQVACPDSDDTGSLVAGRNSISDQQFGAIDAGVAAFADFVHSIEGLRITERKKGDALDGNHEKPAAGSSDGNTKQQLSHPDHDTGTGALVAGGYNISATMTQLKSFAQVMALLENSKGPVHFRLLGIKDEVDTSIVPVEPELWAGEDGEGSNVNNEEKAPEIHRAGLDDINRQIGAAINSQESKKIKYPKVTIMTEPYRVYVVDPVTKFALTLLKVEPREKPLNQILSISLVNAKLVEKTSNQITQIEQGQEDEPIDQSAFLEAIKQNLRAEVPAQITNQSISDELKEEKSGVTSLIEAMKAELRKLPPGQTFQRMLINSNRQEDKQSLLPLKSIIVKQLEESSTQALPQSHQGWTSFMQITRAVLVNFHIAFGSFERIKNCQECGKLFFEKKLGSRRHCSLICKKRYSDKQFGIERQRCMEKQNIWIRRMNDNRNIRSDRIKPFTVCKYHCEDCDIDPKPRGGFCPVLRKRNERLFNRLATIKVKNKERQP